MTNKLSYMHKVCTGKVRFRDSFDILFLAKWTAVHNLVPFTLTLSHIIIAIRVGLRKPETAHEKSLHPGYQTTGNKEKLGSI